MKKTITIGIKNFKTQKECEDYTRTILMNIGITESIKLKNTDYFNFIFELCKRHPNYDEKFKKFVDFKINTSYLNNRGLELNIVNGDNTITEISWKNCISGKSKTNKALFMSALREYISPQIKDFRKISDLTHCNICNDNLTNKVNHIDHELQFLHLVDSFLKENPKISIPVEYKKKDITHERLFTDNDIWIGKLFEEYHKKNAILRVLCESCNLKREKYKPKIE